MKVRLFTTGRLGVVVGLITTMALYGASPALGQDANPASDPRAEECEVVDLGTLGVSPDSLLETQGRWTTEDCDSRFRAGSDARTYRFEVTDPGRVRIGVTSPDADSYVYLLNEDGGRITENDDNGSRLGARVETDLAPGTYLVEATTVGGRQRGPADFTLTVSRVEGCEFIHLGTLEADADLTASGTWTLQTCGSRFVSVHPAYNYIFNLTQPALVRVDLESQDGDPVLSLASEDRIVAANDDGGHRRNSRVEVYLQPGIYIVEATTYYARDFQPLQADFTLTVHLVDEQTRQQDALLKVEEVHTPEVVVVGDPFMVDYRVGNLGRSNLRDDGNKAYIYVFGSGIRYDSIPRITGIWNPGASYHTADVTAGPTSTRNDVITPFEAVFSSPGSKWVLVAVYTDDADDIEIAFHGTWHNLMVHSGATFDPVEVSIGSRDYTVSAAADDQGLVTTSVTRSDDSTAEVGPRAEAMATYAAGVLTQLLTGLFERPVLAGLSDQADPRPVKVDDPSSSTLLALLGDQYSAALETSGLISAWDAKEAINPVLAEEMLLSWAGSAEAHYASLADDWRDLLERVDDGQALSTQAALTAQSQIVYAESIVANAMAAGEIVEAARRARAGWEDRGVKAMMAELSGCATAGDTLREALESTGAIDELPALDAELRMALPLYGLAVDSALCAAADADDSAMRFLERLGIADRRDLHERLGLTAPPSSPPGTHQLRIVARSGADGSVEHGVELVGGETILPGRRHLSAEAHVNRWYRSGEVVVDDQPIGRIRARRLSDGRIEVGFVDADGVVITPQRPYLPVALPEGVWLRSSQIAVPVVAMMDDAMTDGDETGGDPGPG